MVWMETPSDPFTPENVRDSLMHALMADRSWEKGDAIVSVNIIDDDITDDDLIIPHRE